MQVQPYLFLKGRCEEALAFYAQAAGAETLFSLRFKDSPVPNSQPAQWQDKIMHASWRIGATTLMASDGMHDMEGEPYKGFNLSIAADDDVSGKNIFDALSAGGEVRMPWQATFWTSGFGMLTDKFGVPWMVSVEQEPPKPAAQQ
jgi:PhnB protein